MGLVGGGWRVRGIAGQGNDLLIINHAFVCGSCPRLYLLAFSLTSTSVAMTGSDFLTAAMFLDDSTISSYLTHPSEGINNRGWPGNVVPFAPGSEDEWIALKKFARAHVVGHVTGPPKLLMIIRIPARYAVDHLVARQIQVLDNRPEETIGFAMPVNKDSFPSMHVELVKIEDPVVSSQLLQTGLGLLSS